MESDAVGSWPGVSMIGYACVLLETLGLELPTPVISSRITCGDGSVARGLVLA